MSPLPQDITRGVYRNPTSASIRHGAGGDVYRGTYTYLDNFNRQCHIHVSALLDCVPHNMADWGTTGRHQSSSGEKKYRAGMSSDSSRQLDVILTC
jgi:hypothetical protein